MNAKIKRFFLTLLTAIVVACCTLLAACGEPDAVDQSSIKYDGANITWTAVENADGYTVQIDGGNEYNASTNKFTYKAPATADQVEITITAKSGDKVSESASKLFTRLEKIDEASITFDENGKMSWAEVEGANEYILEINGKEVRTAATDYNEFPKGQTNQIRIKPIALDDSSFSEWSKQLNKDYLAAPTNVKYDGQYLTWKGNQLTNKYAVYINGALFDNNVTGTSYEYNAQSNSFDVDVQAIGNGSSSFNSDRCESSRWIFLADITEFDIKDGILTWPAVDEAQSYIVEMDKVKYEVTTNAFDKIVAGKEVSIRVKPVTEEGTAYFANFSPEQNLTLLKAPTLEWDQNLVLDGEARNAISWNLVEGDVGGFNVKVVSPDGQARVDQVDASMTMYGAAQNEMFIETGKYEVSIQAYPVEDSDSFHSIYSEPIIIERLPAPVAAMQNFIKSDNTDVKEGFNLTWQAVPGAFGYQIYKENLPILGVTQNTTSKIPFAQIITEDQTSGAVINYSIRTVGGVKEIEGRKHYMLSSLSAGDLAAQITVLAQPTNLAIEEYTASWTNVPNASGYAIKSTDASSTTTTSYDLSKLPVGVIEDFGVCAKGNGGNILPSLYTAGVKLVRLASPTNIRLTPNSDGDRLVWDEPANTKATRYDVFWAGSEENATNAAQISNIRDYMDTTSITLHMRSIANYWSGNTYYLTSPASDTVKFTQLSQPVFETEKVDGNNYLIWKAPLNVQNVAIQYRVFIDGIAQSETVRDTKFNIEGLPSGSHTFKVKALSDGKEFVSSDESDEISIYKLETPEVTREGAEYKWTKVDLASGYVVKIGDIEYNLDADTLSFAPNFTKFNEEGYPVSIYAKGDNVDEINSESWSTKQVTKKAGVPQFKVTYCDEEGNPLTQQVANGQIRIEITEASYERGDTIGYRIVIGETTHDLMEGRVYKYDVSEAKDYKVEVYAKGGKFNESGNIYYVESNTDTAKTIKIMPAPAVGDIVRESTAIRWGVVNGASNYGYTVRVTLKNGTIIEMVVNGTTASYSNMTTDKDGNTITAPTANDIAKVEICTNGNGNSDTIIGSMWAEKNF